MTDAIQSKVDALMRSSLKDAEGREMACHTATFDEIVDRVESLILDLVREKGDTSYAVLVLAIASMRMQILLGGTVSEDVLNNFIYRAALKTQAMGREPNDMRETINEILAKFDKPERPGAPV